MTTGPSLFESFNARALAPQQVARTFIPPPHYATLTRNAHTLIVGPRGSGKTTLLKMLQSAALEAWRHPQAAMYRQRVDYTAVFVPTDLAWNAQLLAIGSSLRSDSSSQTLERAAFTTHVLKALVDAIRFRIGKPTATNQPLHRRANLSPRDEARLSRQLASSWHLSPLIPSLDAIADALALRYDVIQRIALTESSLARAGRAERLAQHPFLFIHLISSISASIDLFNRLVQEPGARWAFLFDELELAPTWIRETLLRALRSVDDRLLFKLSLSPFSNETSVFSKPDAPAQGQDFDVITLWYTHKEHGFSFCEDLFRSVAASLHHPNANPREVLGRSAFDTDPEEWRETGTAYRTGSRIHAQLLEHSASDPAFHAYLERKQIFLDRLGDIAGDRRAAELRKVFPILAVRSTFRARPSRSRADQSSRLRSRKAPQIYTGASGLFALVEGNPRWFIGIVGTLLREHLPGSVPPHRQAEEVRKAVDRFRSLLRTIPASAPSSNGPPLGVLSILDTVGSYFFDQTVKRDFNPDPPGSFEVDRSTPSELLEGLGRALNAGAIVYVPTDKVASAIDTLVGKRFRLSYLLAPHYRLPIRLGRSVTLRLILEKSGLSVPSDPQRVEQAEPQLELQL